jgi:UDP-hydrolysing UDP-N-acetyl-D-glucosamine 2-epimerase
MRTIAVVTTSRADYGIYIPILKKIVADSELKLHLIVSGMHLSPDFGMTINEIENDGFAVAERLVSLLSSDSPEGIAKSMGISVIGFSQAFARSDIDILVVLGDRFEMHAAALAALPFKIPVVHIHGGEVTQGAIDDALRHSMTKLSHLHFVATNTYANRIIQMGEEPWRVVVSGAPSLDNLVNDDLLDSEEIEKKYGIQVPLDQFLLITFHPVTLEYERTSWQVGELLTALSQLRLPCVFTMPNADTHGRIIRRMILEFAKTHKNIQVVESLGTRGYFSLMRLASVMVGNSSSGMVEAASFELPVVNVGTRQFGRVHGSNVIHTGYSHQEIVEGVQKTIKPDFKDSIKGLINPYGRGNASSVIINSLKSIPINQKLIVKQFNDIEGI